MLFRSDDDDFVENSLESGNQLAKRSGQSNDDFVENSIESGIQRLQRNGRKPRILALHGARSNNHVTRMQLDNLKITSDKYDIMYLNGPIEVEEGDADLTSIVHGPFYSWIDKDNMKESLIASIRGVLTVNKHHGPFDGIYGFSSGAVIAAFAANIAEDESLRNEITSSLQDANARPNPRPGLARGKSYKKASLLDLMGKSDTDSSSKQRERRPSFRKRPSFARENIFGSAIDLEKELLAPPSTDGEKRPSLSRGGKSHGKESGSGGKEDVKINASDMETTTSSANGQSVRSFSRSSRGSGSTLGSVNENSSIMDMMKMEVEPSLVEDDTSLDATLRSGNKRVSILDLDSEMEVSPRRNDERKRPSLTRAISKKNEGISSRGNVRLSKAKSERYHGSATNLENKTFSPSSGGEARPPLLRGGKSYRKDDKSREKECVKTKDSEMELTISSANGQNSRRHSRSRGSGSTLGSVNENSSIMDMMKMEVEPSLVDDDATFSNISDERSKNKRVGILDLGSEMEINPHQDGERKKRPSLTRAISQKTEIMGGGGNARLSRQATERSLNRVININLDANLNTIHDGSVQSQTLAREDLLSEPFQYSILACAATPAGSIAKLRNAAGLLGSFSCQIPSIHLVGIEDRFKRKSEELASLFEEKRIFYLPGGHIISRDERNDLELITTIKDFILGEGMGYTNFFPEQLVEPTYKSMSKLSNVALLPHIQVALVQFNEDNMPNKDDCTILKQLGNQPASKGFLYNAREEDCSKCTTYGDLINFIEGGEGDLRRLGIKAGEVVAYGAPLGGGAPAAVAFLAIGAQTAAAPLAPDTAEPDAYDALEQFHAKHLLLFEGVDCPGVEAAFNQYAKKGKGKIHRARISDDKPGLFKFVSGEKPRGEQLSNPSDGICLLLRTSGTTSRPKGVPLEQASLIANGMIIGASMKLTPDDVVYSVMPLFHIGGISASILCTLVTGGSCSCDGLPFDSERMVDALALSKPQPTWYSSVPTIHNSTVAYLKNNATDNAKLKAYGVKPNGVWKKGHSLRMIRSGAAALLGPDGEALTAAYGGVPIYPTYSMSEQMPISQPPAGKKDTFTSKPGSVGVPVAASCAIVSRGNLRPLPHGHEGEIAISGPTVLKNYLENPDADRKSYFYLSLPVEESMNDWDFLHQTDLYFLTGDVGVMDKDGFLSLRGRAKELIKKGGEQVSPFEVEEPLLDHPWVQSSVCFSVPSKMYGEEVGCAIVSSVDLPEVSERELIIEMRSCLKKAKLAIIKWPTKWKFVNERELPKTKTKKYIRVGLSTKLGMDIDETELEEYDGTTKARVDWGAISGARFLLALYVMLMHFGTQESWGAFNNLRDFPWHVHCFFTIGGYSMATPMNPAIGKKFKYFLARIGGMYPLYFVCLIFCLANLLVVCRPSTFSEDFHWNAQPNDLYDVDGNLSPLFCEGTPATRKSYWLSLTLTVLTYIFGLAVTPFWPLTWWLGFYLWFSSMYHQCLAFFPSVYNALYNRMRKDLSKLIKIMIVLQLLNYAILLLAWFFSIRGTGYSHYDIFTGEKNSPEDYTEGHIHNALVLSFFLFGPFWGLYFIIGATLAFLYDAYRPAERHNGYMWGWIADACSLAIIGFSVAQVLQGDPEGTEEYFMRPDEANQKTDVAIQNRIWSNICARMWCPVTTLWLFGISTGKGITSRLLGSKFLVNRLSPHAYKCFLFHQVVGQWYFAATRNGQWWNWWRYRKTMYWFSPAPCPVNWYEYFPLVILVVLFSMFVTVFVEPMMNAVISFLMYIFCCKKEDDNEDTGEMLKGIIASMTGIEPELDWSLEDCGLASIGVPVLIDKLNKSFSNRDKKVAFSPTDLVEAETIGEMTKIIDGDKALADADGI